MIVYNIYSDTQIHTCIYMWCIKINKHNLLHSFMCLFYIYCSSDKGPIPVKT